MASLEAAADAAGNDLAAIIVTAFRHDNIVDQELPTPEFAAAMRAICDRKGAALIVPARLLQPVDAGTPSFVAEDPHDRRQCELAAMEAVMAAERAAGRVPVDVSAAKVGYDIESRDPATGDPRFIEVKGRHDDAEVVIVTRNEILTAINAGERFWLALVRVNKGYAGEPTFIPQPFRREPDFGSTAVVYSIDELMAARSAEVASSPAALAATSATGANR